MIKINKRFIASGVALTLLSSAFTCCTARVFKYTENSNNEIIAEGTVSYDYLKNCYYLEIKNPDYDKIEYYIAYLEVNYNVYGPNVYKYINLLNGVEVYRKTTNDEFNGTNRRIISEKKLDEYLYSSDFIKSTYTLDDVKKILEAIKENERGKKLVKER